MVVFICLVHLFFVVGSLCFLVHILLCVGPSWPRLILYAVNDHIQTCINANMQPCGNGPQTNGYNNMRANDLSIKTHNGGFDRSLHVDCEL